MSRNKSSVKSQTSLFSDDQLADPTHDKIMRWTQGIIKNDPDLALNYCRSIQSAPTCVVNFLSASRSSSPPQLEAHLGEELVGKVTKFFVESTRSAREEVPKSDPSSAESIFWEVPLRDSVESKRESGWVDMRALVSSAHPEFRISIEVHSLRIRTSRVARVLSDQLEPDETFPLSSDFSRRLGDGSRCLYVSEDGLHLEDALLDRNSAIDKFDVSKWLEQNETVLIRETRDPAVICGNWLLVLHEAEWHQVRSTQNVYFEIKTEVRSHGELIRQLRFYVARGADPIVVVAPKAEHLQEILSDQGFGYLEYAPQSIG